jgi:nucleotide-binding universal stress UspA family protein
MYERILVPTDGSRGSSKAARHALDIAECGDATVHVLSVVGSSDLALDEDEADPERERRAERAVDQIVEIADQRDRGTVTAVRRGKPHQEILRYADENDVDLVVMGTHGRTGLDRYLIGSVAERIVRTADVPVLTVSMEDAEVVKTADEALEIAREALEKKGHADVALESPSPQRSSWVVPAEAEGATFNVYVDRGAGTAHVVRRD